VLRLLVLIALFYAAWTCVVVPYQSWGAEMSTDYFEKGRIASYREAGTVLGIMVGIGVPLLLLDPVAAPLRELVWGEAQPFGSSQAAVLEAIAWLVIVLLPLTVAISLTAVPDPAIADPPRGKLTEALRVFRRNPPFARLLSGYFFAQLGFLIYLSLVVLFITRVLELREFLLLVFLQHMAAVLVIPLWQRLIPRVGKHRAYVWSLLSMMASLGLMALVEPGELGQAIVVYLLLGIGSGAKLILPPAMAADAVDLDTLRTGRTEAGLFMALLNMTNKATFALSVGIGYGLIALSGFDPASAGPQPAGVLVWLTLGVPVLVMGIGCAIMWNYPLDARRQGIVRRRLVRRRAQAG
jgi:Na+/melibiose symporter-like transporter